MSVIHTEPRHFLNIFDDKKNPIIEIFLIFWYIVPEMICNIFCILEIGVNRHFVWDMALRRVELQKMDKSAFFWFSDPQISGSKMPAAAIFTVLFV